MHSHTTRSGVRFHWHWHCMRAERECSSTIHSVGPTRLSSHRMTSQTYITRSPLFGDVLHRSSLQIVMLLARTALVNHDHHCWNFCSDAMARCRYAQIRRSSVPNCPCPACKQHSWLALRVLNACSFSICKALDAPMPKILRLCKIRLRKFRELT